MATIRVPTFRRSVRNASQADKVNITTDAQKTKSGPELVTMSYVWLCVIVGAAASIGIAAGVGMDRADLTQGATSWMAGAVAFSIAFVPLLIAWVIAHAGK
jgi:hypothetical protein